MNKIILNLMICAIAILATSCSDDDNTGYRGPTEPGDSYFGGGAIDEGTPLVSANIDVTKFGIVTGDPTDPDELAALKEQRRQVVAKAISDMVFVDGGSFLMGATAEQGSDVHIYEKNVRKVTLSDYYVSKYQVTQELYLIVMGGANQGSFKEEGNLKYPIDNRLYSEMQTFVTKLNDITGLNFALPTEAQWEFAARGGRKRTGTLYAGSNNINEVACYWDNSLRIPAGQDEEKRWPEYVGTKKANELGVYDMSGNIGEVCQDWYDLYKVEDEIDPLGPDSIPLALPQKRVCRGGGWITYGNACRVSARSAFLITGRFNYVGFRLVHPKID